MDRGRAAVTAALACALAASAAGCGGDAGHADHPPQQALSSFRAASTQPAPKSHAARCRPRSTPGTTITLRVPDGYRLVPAGRSGCLWQADHGVVAQLTVTLTSTTLAREARIQRDPARNGEDDGVTQAGPRHLVYAADTPVFGALRGERLGYLTDFEGIDVRVRQARFAPLTLSLAVSADDRPRFRRTSRTFASIERSVAVAAEPS